MDEGHRLGPGGHRLAEEAPDGGRDGHRARLADAAHAHAQVFGLDDDEDAPRAEDRVEGVGDLGGQPFLDLGRRLKPSTNRASLDRPVIRPSSPGM